MLAMFHGAQADLGTHRRNARGVNHHIDETAGNEQVHIIRNSNFALLHDSIEGRR